MEVALRFPGSQLVNLNSALKSDATDRSICHIAGGSGYNDPGRYGSLLDDQKTIGTYDVRDNHGAIIHIMKLFKRDSLRSSATV